MAGSPSVCHIGGSGLISAVGSVGIHQCLEPEQHRWIDVYVAVFMHNLHACFHGCFSSQSSLCKVGGNWGKRMTDIHRMSHLVLDVQTSSVNVSSYEQLQWTQISSHSVPIWRDIVIDLLLDLIVTDFPIMFLPHFYHSAKLITIAHEFMDSCISGHLPLQVK